MNTSSTVLRFTRAPTPHRRPTVYLIAAITAAALIFAPRAFAEEFPSLGAYHYSVRHSLFGKIGEQTIQLTRQGQDVIVTMEARIKIKVLYLTLLQLHTRAHETWRDGRMIAFEGRSKEDNEITTISAKKVAHGMMIEGPKGKIFIAGPLALTNPWNRAVLDAPTIIEPTSGSVLSVKTAPAGSQSIHASGRSIRAQKFVVSGDMEAEVWFAEDGALSRLEFPKSGGHVIIGLESFNPLATLPVELADGQNRDSAIPQ